MDEPLLDAADIQGHVLTGFGGGYQILIGFKIRPERLDTVRTVLTTFVDAHVTHGRKAMALRASRQLMRAQDVAFPLTSDLLAAVGVSASGIRVFGGDPAAILDPFFASGPASDASSLGDDIDADGRPVSWKFGDREETTPDVLIIFGSGSRQTAADGAQQLLAQLADSVTVVYREEGRRLPGDTEHFGFVDGISQPGFRGRTDATTYATPRSLPPDNPLAEQWARPGQPLTWPGQFIFGYAGLQPDAPLEPGPAVGDVPLLKNGSLLVLRRLTQDVDGFRNAMKALATQLSKLTNTAWDDETVSARCVGRWRDGTPVTQSPRQPDQAISGDPFRRNGFQYLGPIAAMTLNDAGQTVSYPGADADPVGARCPFFGHVRKVNPRDHPTDDGSANMTLRFQMLRRGIPFGPAWPGSADGQERGLIFLSYQTSIAQQFRHLMTRWVKSPNQPLDGGIDPLIGPPPATGRALKMAVNGKTVALNLPGRFVTTTGSAYLLVPGIQALRRLVSGSEAIA